MRPSRTMDGGKACREGRRPLWESERMDASFERLDVEELVVKAMCRLMRLSVLDASSERGWKEARGEGRRVL